MKAKKKPVLVDVWQLPATFKQDFINNLPAEVKSKVTYNGPFSYLINSLEGPMNASIDDYLVYGGNHDVWVVKKYIFEKTYEIVEVEE